VLTAVPAPKAQSGKLAPAANTSFGGLPVLLTNCYRSYPIAAKVWRSGSSPCPSGVCSVGEQVGERRQPGFDEFEIAQP